jgi:hypothetical protein
MGLDKCQNLAVTGKLDAVSASNPPLIANWGTNNIHLTLPTSCTNIPTTIDMYADVPFSPIFMNTRITMRAYHQERWIGQ